MKSRLLIDEKISRSTAITEDHEECALYTKSFNQNKPTQANTIKKQQYETI